MPTYEYLCTKCGERKEIKATISEKEKGLKVVCPKCGSRKMAQVFGNFFTAAGSSKSKGGPPICGPMAGPGCCG